MKKSNRKFRMKHPNWVFQAIDAIAASQDTTPEHADGIMKPVRAALQALLDGKAGETEYRRVGSALNVATIRAKQIGDNADAVQVLQAASFAMLDCLRIRHAHGRYGLTGPGRLAIQDGIDLYETILRGSTPRQMYDAERELERMLARGKTANGAPTSAAQGA